MIKSTEFGTFKFDAVPLSVVFSFKKIKAFVSSTTQLAGILRNSTKLVSFYTVIFARSN